jgi:AraC-like DNA-binding protein
MKPDTGRAAITIRFALPAARLRPFVTTYYRTEAVTCASQPWIEDVLHPEWPNLRFLAPGCNQAAIGTGRLRDCSILTATGPTSLATRFRHGAGRSWGIGLLPLGWATLVRTDAHEYADRFVDAMDDPMFARFHPLAQALAASTGGFAEELALIEEHMARIEWTMPRGADAIRTLNAALVDRELASVADLAARVGMNVRSLERLSRRAFGFPPKLLLRRQRFLRSLAQFMLDPSMNWLSTLDWQYHDQAHFVRDFRRFMGMSPSAYARLDKPLLLAAAQARMAIAGEALQVLHDPDAAD